MPSGVKKQQVTINWYNATQFYNSAKNWQSLLAYYKLALHVWPAIRMSLQCKTSSWVTKWHDAFFSYKRFCTCWQRYSKKLAAFQFPGKIDRICFFFSRSFWEIPFGRLADLTTRVRASTGNLLNCLFVWTVSLGVNHCSFSNKYLSTSCQFYL